MSLSQEKKAFRKESLVYLKRLSSTLSKRYAKDKKVLAYLYNIIEQQKADTIMLYLPLTTEVNLYPLIKKLRQQRKPLYVPFMEGKSFRLVKYRLPLKRKQFSIKEPNDSKQYRPKQIDIAIVPIVGIDKGCKRIGFGRGMYDRFFEKNKCTIKQTIFIARYLCYAQKSITDDYDVQADVIITP